MVDRVSVTVGYLTVPSFGPFAALIAAGGPITGCWGVERACGCSFESTLPAEVVGVVVGGALAAVLGGVID